MRFPRASTGPFPQVTHENSERPQIRDLDFGPDEAAHLLVRADLMIQLQKALAARNLKQAEAANLLRVTQPRVSDLLRGRIELFSSDTLIDMLANLGMRVRLVLKRPGDRKSPNVGFQRRRLNASCRRPLQTRVSLALSQYSQRLYSQERSSSGGHYDPSR